MKKRVEKKQGSIVSLIEGCFGWILSKQDKSALVKWGLREDLCKISPNPFPVTNLFPYSPINLFTSKKVAFNKPSRGTSDSERRTIINGNRVFRFDCERCRLEDSEQRVNATAYSFNANCPKRGAAFTLAETLITLGIIGVVAAITMPVLVSKIQDMVFLNQRKKAYSEFLQAFESVKMEDGFVESDPWPGAYNNFKAIQSKFKVVKSCENARDEGCWIDTCNLDLTERGQVNTSVSGCWNIAKGEAGQANTLGFIDTAGRQWIIYKKYGATWLLVDVNGDKKPNLIGKDRFGIYTSEEKGKYYTTWRGVPRYTDVTVSVLIPD